MSSGFFNILEKYGLGKVADLPQNISSLSDSNLSDLANELDAYYNTLSPPPNTTSPLVFDFPSLPTDLLPQISTHLLFADRVFLDDPLLRILSPFRTVEAKGFQGFLAQRFPHLDIDIHDLFDIVSFIARETIVNEATKTLQFYLQAKELIQEGRLFIYRNDPPSGYTARYYEISYNLARKDRRFHRIVGLDKGTILKGTLALLLRRPIPDKSPLATRLDDAFFENFSKLIKKISLSGPMVSSMPVFVRNWGKHGTSTDFIHPDLAYLFRMELEFITQLNKELPSDQQIPVPASFSLSGLRIPALQNVPVERVLEILSKESVDFLSFRSALHEKLLQITAPPGTPEREREIAVIVESLQKEIYGLQAIFEKLRQDFIRKLAINLALSSFSIAIAGISTSPQNLNIISLLSSIFASTALGASVKEMINECAEFKAKRDELKANSNYFVWKLYREGSRRTRAST